MEREVCAAHSGLEARLQSICRKIDDQGKLIEIQIQMQKDSISMAKEELERRLESMNEFREQLSRQAQTFISRHEMDLRLEKLEERHVLTLRPIQEKIKEFEATTYKEAGSLTWKNHIMTVIISLAIFIVIHFVFKI